VRGLETAAGAIVLFGIALLTGYMVSERLGGVKNLARHTPLTRQ
jgi:hypothetical protein